VDSEAEEIEGTVAQLTHAMTGLLRVIDAKGADAVAGHLSETLLSALEELMSRLNAIRGYPSGDATLLMYGYVLVRMGVGDSDMSPTANQRRRTNELLGTASLDGYVTYPGLAAGTRPEPTNR
jgi:hypothetical protein